MSKILVTYATMAGSTAEVAQVIGEEISKSGHQVEILPIQKVGDMTAYAGVVVGAPMIMGWHREALGFLRHHRVEFKRIPLAVFVMAMSLTQTSETTIEGVPVYVDQKFSKPPRLEGKMSFKERYARLSNYLRPISRAVHPSKPVSIAVFGGRMEYGRLKWWAVLFAMLIIQAAAGDKRDWEAIRSWARGIPAAFHLE